ncbi:MAG: N-formylglutamate amidohydrolase [Desulfobulbus sp.]|nr:MAG: N-formylglutamate amidohydrolase [Desulfobulbus sp.]
MANCSCPEPFRLLLTCEHAVNTVPPEYAPLFAGHEEILESHRGYDLYALEIADRLARLCRVPLLAAAVTRLLVDCNRSPAGRNLFSSYSRPLAAPEKTRLLAARHTPHQTAVADGVSRIIASGRTALHLAVHTFTPVLHGKVRTADLGLLYDPARTTEKHLCARWLAELKKTEPALRLRRNYPYLGKSDSLPTVLRRRFSEERYLGIELEINQGYAGRADLALLAELIAITLGRALAPGQK